jgi:hypothetical protein
MAKSKLGFHTGPGGMKNGLGDWMRTLNQAGIPFGLKAADDYGPAFEAVNVGRQHNLQNWIGFRFSQAAHRISREVPDYNVAPWADAPILCQELLDKLPPEFDKSVWLEPINEPRDENSGTDSMFNNMNATDYLGEWCLAAAQFLNARGYKMMGPSFNAGRPGREGFPLEDAVAQYSQPGMLKFLRYCADHPDQAALSVHDYSWALWQEGQTADSWYPNLWGRFEAAIAAADLHDIPRTFPIFVTEFGFAHRQAPRWPEVESYLDARNRMLARWPQVKYDAAWTLQEGWNDIDKQVNSWLNYDAQKEFDEGEQPARTHPLFGGTLPGAAPAFAYQMVNFAHSVANFDNMQPGQQFTGTWTLRNTGTAVWSNDFRAVYVDQSAADTQTATRAMMGAPASSSLRALTGRDRIDPGETVDFRFELTAPTQPGAYAFHWQLQDGHGRALSNLHWLKAGVVAPVDTTPTRPERPTTIQFGMNINPHPGGHPLDVERLTGLNWVRFVYWASREQMSVEEAYQQRYRQIIQSYASAGIGSLIILHQDTYWGNGPWENGGWESYAENFGRECGRVARVCAEFGDRVAYQIFNEQDSGYGSDAGNVNSSAIGFGPAEYALVLDRAAAAIRAAQPAARVIFGGLKTGPHDAIPYAQETQRRLGGRLPVDGMAYHPYGRYVKTPFFNFGAIGKLADALNQFKQAFPGLPLWITELGVAADSQIGAEHYPTIATYITEVTEELTGKFADYVRALIWFGWTDLMRNAGINTVDNQPKPHVYAAFEAMKKRGLSPEEPVDPPPGKAEAKFVSYSSSLINHNAVPAGSTFTSRWTFKNSGTTSWDDSYQLVYAPGGTHPVPMTAESRYKLSAVAGFTRLEPGKTAVISLTMTAPEKHGRTYRSRWELRDPQGQAIGFLYQDITVVPAPVTAGWPADMAFVADQTIPDNSRIVAGTNFDKQWRVKNSGRRHWGAGFRLVFVEGDLAMAQGDPSHIIPAAAPGEEVTLTVPMTAPPARNGQPTLYRSMWRLQDDRGGRFGDPVWAVIVSTTAAASSPANDTPLNRLLNAPELWYSQLDPAWAAERMGNGTATIGSWGCLMCCMAMTLSAFGARLNPRELHQRVRQIGPSAIVGADIQFAAPGAVAGLSYRNNVASWPNSNILHAIWTGEDPIQRIDKAIAEGNIVIAQVDINPNNGFYNSNNEQHWVIPVKRTADGSDYLMIDPLTPPAQQQLRSLMDKYGRRLPGRSHEENLRHAIKSSLVYHKPGG